MTIIRLLFIFLGAISLGIGILGIVVPGLPATPFFLLTAGLWLRSSDRLYRKLLANPVVGRYIHDFYSRKGMTPATKIYSIILMWTMITISCGWFINSLAIIMVVIVTGIIGTIIMGFIIPTVRDDKKSIGNTGEKMQVPREDQKREHQSER